MSMNGQYGLPGFDISIPERTTKKGRRMSEEAMEKAANKATTPLYTMEDMRRDVEAKLDAERANILVAGGIKGGGHKTSTAVNLALAASQVLGLNVLFIDTDDVQKTATRHFQARRKAGGDMEHLTVVNLMDEDVAVQTLKMAKNYELVVIDCGGYDSASLRAALSIGDRLVVPVAPRPYDYWAAGEAAKVINAIRTPRLRVTCVLSGAYSGKAPENDAYAEKLGANQTWTMAPTFIRSRRVWDRTAIAGEAVFEIKPADKAATDELARLAAAVL